MVRKEHLGVGATELLTVWLKPDVLHVSHTDVSRSGSSPVE
jgi:hypothetical protein